MTALREEVGDQPRLLLFELVGASACQLLIACTNLASLTIHESQKAFPPAVLPL